MTIEPGEQDGPGTRHPVSARRASALEADSAARSGPRTTSPLRVLLVIVPLLVLAGAGAYLVNAWITSLLQAAAPPVPAPDGPAKEAQRRPASGGIASQERPAEQAERPFDAGLAVALLARARPEDGAAPFKMCGICHSSEKNAPHRIGSNLWGIVGQPVAALPGFNYSAALRAKGGVWSYRALAEYLSDPRKFAPGTSMAFFGIRDEKRAADLIAYLRTLSDSPPPLPR